MPAQYDLNDPVIAHAYGEYPDEASYAQSHDALLRRYFAGELGNNRPWRATPDQRAAFRNSQQTSNAGNRQVRDIETLTEDLRKRLARDRGALATSTNPTYPGRKHVPMSSLEQKRRAIVDKYNNKPKPYNSLINEIRSREAQGFSPEQIQSLLTKLRDKGTGVTENMSLPIIQKLFRDNDEARDNYFRRKTSKDIANNEPSVKRDFEVTGNTAKAFNSEYNTNLANTLQHASDLKVAGRKAHADLLGELGNQQHAYEQNVNTANRARFDKELNEPQRKIGLLSELLSRNGGATDEDSASGAMMEEANRRVLEQGKRLYDAPTPSYLGKTVADVPHNMTDSYQKAERLSPSYQDTSHDQRKKLKQNLVNRLPVGTRAIDELSTHVDPYEQDLDRDLKRSLKKERDRITAEHVRSGIAGSPAHRTVLERKLREFAEKAHRERADLYNKGLEHNIKTFNNNDISDLNRFGDLATSRTRELGDIFKHIRTQNDAGAQVWGNNQAQLNSEQDQFEDEKNREWGNLGLSTGSGTSRSPHMNAVNVASRAAGITPDISLNSLAKRAPVAFSEQHKAPVQALPAINNAQDAQAAGIPVGAADAEQQRQAFIDSLRDDSERWVYGNMVSAGTHEDAMAHVLRSRANFAAYVPPPPAPAYDPARINQDAMDRLRGTGAYAPTPSPTESGRQHALQQQQHGITRILQAPNSRVYYAGEQRVNSDGTLWNGRNWY